MTICLLKSKIHRATVTGASIDYEGSLTIAADLAERVGLRPYEKILVGNLVWGLPATDSRSCRLRGSTRPRPPRTSQR